jgi:hypothetical protein
LLVTAFVSIVLGSIFALVRTYPIDSDWSDFAFDFIVRQSPFWMPIAFLGYIIGRKTITMKVVIAFAIAQAIAVGATTLAKGHRF